MKKLLTLIWFCCVIVDFALCQQWSRQEIKKQIPSVFVIHEFDLGNGRTHTYPSIDTLPPANALSVFVKEHRIYIDYLLSLYSTVKFEPIDTNNRSLRQKNEAYHNQLMNDSTFTKYFVQSCTYYLESLGFVVSDRLPMPKQTLTKADLMHIAVRFFSRIEAKQNGHIAWRLTLKTDPDYNNEIGSQPLVEAFCYEAVLNWSTTKEWRTLKYDTVFYEEVKRLNQMISGVNDPTLIQEEVRLAMRNLMLKSVVLEKVLIDYYNKSRTWVGFEVL